MAHQPLRKTHDEIFHRPLVGDDFHPHVLKLTQDMVFKTVFGSSPVLIQITSPKPLTVSGAKMSVPISSAKTTYTETISTSAPCGPCSLDGGKAQIYVWEDRNLLSRSLITDIAADMSQSIASTTVLGGITLYVNPQGLRSDSQNYVQYLTVHLRCL